MNNRHYYCVILCGGIGSRFWPMSTRDCPKQFHDILGTGKTLLQQTFARASSLIRIENIFLVTHSDYKQLVLDQLPDFKESNLLLEPLMRNTAPSIAYASFKIHEFDKEAILFIAPSDHLIIEEARFFKTIACAFQRAAQREILITLGITPTRPDPGYGYVQFHLENSASVKKVKTFVEKPASEIAKQFIDSGDFLWNSGIFVWHVQTILKAFKMYLPEMFNAFSRIVDTFNSSKESKNIEAIFPAFQRISIDYGILERAQNVYVIVADFGWSDLGTWGTLYEKNSKDQNGNASVGKKILFYDSRDNMVFLDNDKVAVIDGLNNYIIVDTDKALLICKRENEQEIKMYINDLKISRAEHFL